MGHHHEHEHEHHRHHHDRWYHDESEEARAYEAVHNAPHKAKLSHELIAGAASFAAMKAYNEHVQKNGKPVSHAMAKEILAGFTGVFLDRLVETKGLDFVDRERAKHAAEKALAEASARDY